MELNIDKKWLLISNEERAVVTHLSSNEFLAWEDEKGLIKGDQKVLEKIFSLEKSELEEILDQINIYRIAHELKNDGSDKYKIW